MSSENKLDFYANEIIYELRKPLEKKKIQKKRFKEKRIPSYDSFCSNEEFSIK